MKAAREKYSEQGHLQQLECFKMSVEKEIYSYQTAEGVNLMRMTCLTGICIHWSALGPLNINISFQQIIAQPTEENLKIFTTHLLKSIRILSSLNSSSGLVGSLISVKEITGNFFKRCGPSPRSVPMHLKIFNRNFFIHG